MYLFSFENLHLKKCVTHIMNIRMLLFVSFFGWYTYSHIILTKDQWLTPSHWPMANHGPWFCLNLLRGPLLAPSHWKSGHSNQGPMVKPWSLILAEFPRGPLLAPSHWKPNQGQWFTPSRWPTPNHGPWFWLNLQRPTVGALPLKI